MEGADQIHRRRRAILRRAADSRRKPTQAGGDLGLHFMDTETYAQFSLPPDRVEKREYIKEGGLIDIVFHAETEEPLTTAIPKSVELEVVQTDPGLKGDTATGATKPATLESGAVVNVPLFIEEGDMVRVNTDSGEYLTRVSTSKAKV